MKAINPSTGQIQILIDPAASALAERMKPLMESDETDQSVRQLLQDILCYSDEISDAYSYSCGDLIIPGSYQYLDRQDWHRSASPSSADFASKVSALALDSLLRHKDFNLIITADGNVSLFYDDREMRF